MLGKLLVADRVAATNYMLEKMRQDAVDQTLNKWKTMVTEYHIKGYDDSNGKMDKTCRELIHLGFEMNELIDIEFEIMEKVYG